ncbi:MAG: Npt1/Npt2 family nucleotide transporter [Rickettsiaceae bacterium]
MLRAFSKLNSQNTLENYSISKNKFLDYIWPIHRHELSKFLFITLLMFCILGIQNLIRALKDSIINTMIGTQTIAFLKFGGVMPSAILITIIYIKLVSVMKTERIFYLIMSCFLLFFALFAFYLFPNHQSLHLSVQNTNHLISIYPNAKWLILPMSNWSFSLFYIIAELWPNVVFALLFWQFVNSITNVEQSARFYPLFGLLGQSGLYISGQFLSHLPQVNEYVINKFSLHRINDDHALSIQIVLVVVIALGLIALGTFWLLYNILLDKSIVQNIQFQAKKNQLGLIDSIKTVLSSRYILLIAIMLICYGTTINLVEGPWKALASTVYTTPTSFAAFVGNYLSYTGLFTILFVLICSNIVRRAGWFAAAIITPMIVFVTGFGFFIISDFDFMPILYFIGFAITDPVSIAVVFGAVQNILSKSSKYALFDATKEMAYVPLPYGLKTKGKAAADIVGTKLGKSFGSFLQIIIFVIFPNAQYNSISFYLMIVFVVICICWIYSVIQLNKEYKSAISKPNTKNTYGV